ncbi:hypothetical protein ACHAPU_002316 [Fusarium lateritium]
MRILEIILYSLRYGWQMIKSLPRALIGVFRITLPLTILTIIVGTIQGLVLGAWYHGTQMEQTRLLAYNMVTFKTYEWFKEPYGRNPLRIPRAPYHIQRLYNPLDWVQEVNMVRPRDWHTDNFGVLARFDDLHRRRRQSGDLGWHHWIYLSANDQPLNETWNVDPWDKAFLDLLQHRDKHEPQGRSNFNYITCPRSFLCHIWSISGPALVHFTNEPVQQNATWRRSLKPILDPVSVRVFELPLEKPVIPGRFPSQFEQMRCITASNSTYWETREKYSNFYQVRGQAFKVIKKMENKYPSTYGGLVWLENKWVSLWAPDDLVLVTVCRHLPFIAAAGLTYYGAGAWYKLQLWWNDKVDTQLQADNSTPQLATGPIADDPVARRLQYFLDSFSEEDKKKFGKTQRGGALLERIQNGLETEDWNSRKELVGGLKDALKKGNW